MTISTNLHRDIAVAPLIVSGGLLTYIHEVGHKIALHTLLNNCSSQITVKHWFFGGGHVDYNHLGLASLGQLIGSNATEGTIGASGPLINVLQSFVFLEVAKRYVKKDPITTAIWASHALLPPLAMIEYAVRDIYYSSVSGGDFSRFSNGTGISPNATLLGSISVFALPILYSVNMLIRAFNEFNKKGHLELSSFSPWKAYAFGVSGFLLGNNARTLLALASKKLVTDLVLSNCRSRIEISDWISGTSQINLLSGCSFQSDLSPLGRLIGPDKSSTLVASSGSVAVLGVGILLQDFAQRRSFDQPMQAMALLIGSLVLPMMMLYNSTNEFMIESATQSEISPLTSLMLSLFITTYLTWTAVGPMVLDQDKFEELNPAHRAKEFFSSKTVLYLNRKLFGNRDKTLTSSVEHILDYDKQDNWLQALTTIESCYSSRHTIFRFLEEVNNPSSEFYNIRRSDGCFWHLFEIFIREFPETHSLMNEYFMDPDNFDCPRYPEKNRKKFVTLAKLLIDCASKISTINPNVRDLYHVLEIMNALYISKKNSK